MWQMTLNSWSIISFVLGIYFPLSFSSLMFLFPSVHSLNPMLCHCEYAHALISGSLVCLHGFLLSQTKVVNSACLPRLCLNPCSCAGTHTQRAIILTSQPQALSEFFRLPGNHTSWLISLGFPSDFVTPHPSSNAKCSCGSLKLGWWPFFIGPSWEILSYHHDLPLTPTTPSIRRLSHSLPSLLL